MRPTRFSLSPAVADPDGIAQLQTATGGGALTLNGALAGTMDVPRHASLTSTGNLSTITFTVAGTDRFDTSITDAITGPNATTVNGTKNFKTVTSVTPSAAVGGQVSVGSSANLETQWVPRNQSQPVGTVAVVCTSSGLTYTLQTTPDNVQAAGFQESSASTFNDATIASKTDSFRGQDTMIAAAARLSIAVAATGTLTANFHQGRDR